MTITLSTGKVLELTPEEAEELTPLLQMAVADFYYRQSSASLKYTAEDHARPSSLIIP